MTMAMMAATVWFIPGWLRTTEPHEDVLSCVSNVFPEASVEFKNWDGDNLVWPLSVDSADKESWRFAFEIATMAPEERANLTPEAPLPRYFAATRKGREGRRKRQNVAAACCAVDFSAAVSL